MRMPKPGEDQRGSREVVWLPGEKFECAKKSRSVIPVHCPCGYEEIVQVVAIEQFFECVEKVPRGCFG